MAVDASLVGTLKGVGRVNLQTVIDCYSGYAWGRLYTNKLPVTAVHVLNTDVLPRFELHNAWITTILSDNGQEFCARRNGHPHELFLQLEGIEHRTTRVRRLQSNGFVERMHKTLLDDPFRIRVRAKSHEPVEERQKELDAFLDAYITGVRTRGGTRRVERRTRCSWLGSRGPEKPRRNRRREPRKRITLQGRLCQVNTVTTQYLPYRERPSESASRPVDVKTLHGKIGELTMETNFLETAPAKAGLLSAKL